MKLSKSKLALAKVINENGGWVDGANWSAQDKDGEVFHFSSKPTRGKSREVWDHRGCIRGGEFIAEKIPNWHQTILSCEEYYQAYPKADDIKLDIRWVRGGEVCATPTSHDCMVMLKERGYYLQCDCKECNDFYRREETSHEDDDADGWIEWDGGECPVHGDDIVDVACSTDGAKSISAVAGRLRWGKRGLGGDIIAYRLHKPDVKPEFCESVTRGIPEPEKIEELAEVMGCNADIESIIAVAKSNEDWIKQLVGRVSGKKKETSPTIEQLAADHRNKLEFANRKQLEAEDARVVADCALAELERAGDELGLRIGIASNNKATVIEGWRDLRVGDIVFIESMIASNEWSEAMVGRECTVVSDGESYPICFANDFTPEGESYWIGGIEEGRIDWRFVRRP